MRLDPWNHRGLAVLAAGVLAALTTGCGSTVQMAGQQQASGLNEPQNGLNAPLSSATSQPGSQLTVPGTTGKGPTAQGSLPPTTTLSSALPTTVGGPVRTSGFGFTAKAIYIGVAYDSTLSQELGGAGVGSASVGDQHAQVEAIVGDLNSHGGIGGRQVVPVFYDTKGMTSQNDPNTLAQAACSYWTQDHQVFAAMTYVVQMDNPTLYTCLANKHVVFVPLGGESQETFAKYSPYLWDPAGTTPEAVAPLWAQRLKALGWLAGWNTALGQAGSGAPVVGLLYGNGVRNNEPQLDQSFVKAVMAALSSIGVKVAASAQVTNDQATLASAVLQFQSSHVTHVIGDYSVVNFTTAAESQHYRPRYAMSSFNGGVAMQLFAPPGQLHGAIGMGWVPSGDLQAGQDAGSPAQTRCRAVMQKNGQSTTVRLAWFAMTWACDTFSFFASAIPSSGLLPQNLPAAAAALGQVSGSFTLAIDFRGGRPYGVALARDYGYVDSCSCFEYFGTRTYAL